SWEAGRGQPCSLTPRWSDPLPRVREAKPPQLELLRPDTPRPLVEIVSRMLAKSADGRFADAGKLHEQLLGYFFATGERFGSNKLAELMERFHEDTAAPEMEGGAVFDEKNVANERTPVEVPHPNAQTSGHKPTTSGLSRLSLRRGQRGKRAAAARADEIGARREVTALVLSIFGEDRARAGGDRRGAREGGVTAFSARAREVLARYGATLLEEEPSQIV